MCKVLRQAPECVKKQSRADSYSHGANFVMFFPLIPILVGGSGECMLEVS